MADDDFRHDLIIATEDGVFHIPNGQWNKQDYKVKDYDYEKAEGWQLVRELLQCGANVAVVPPNLPPDKPQPLGTCYVVNLAGFHRSHRFHVSKSQKNQKKK
jgi:hypothetical protein